MKKISRIKAVAIGDRRVENLGREYRERGYFVITNKNYGSGVDLIIIVKDTGQVVKTIESTNYKAIWEYISDEKLERYISSLNQFDVLPNVEKELVVSYEDNLTEQQLKKLGASSIDVRIIGKQD